MAAYLTDTEFRLLTLLPVNVIDEVEVRTPGWLTQQLEHVSSRMNARLAKRYAVPFIVVPYPDIVQEWLAHIVSWRCYLKRGVNSLDSEASEYKAQHDQALNEIKEAADSNVGLFELPLRQDEPGVEGVTRGGPVAYSEQSPYVWTDIQAEIGRNEDSSGGGSFL